jgi:hypothetical protein
MEFDVNMAQLSIKWNLFGNWSRNRNKVIAYGTESLFLDGFAGSSSQCST